MIVSVLIFGSVQDRFYWWMHSRCLPSWFSGPDALQSWPYMGQQEAGHGAVHKTAEIPQLQFIMVVVHSCHYAEAAPPCSCDQEIPMLLDTGDRHPCCAGRAASWVVVQTCRKLWLSTAAFPVSSLTCPFFVHDKFCWCRSCRSSLVVDSLSRRGGRCPCCGPCSFSVAAVERTAAIPQLQPVVLVFGPGRSHARCGATTFVWWFRVQ